MDPTQPIAVLVEIDSPQVVVYRLWFKRPGDTLWTIFATGTDEEATNPSAHQHVVGPLPEGSRIAYHVIFSGNPETFFRVRITASQSGSPLDEPVVIDGTTDASGVAARQGEIEL
ncbi:MAG: hypothetical protein AB1941_00075 [Gemmatimonadota bacterium]